MLLLLSSTTTLCCNHPNTYNPLLIRPPPISLTTTTVAAIPPSSSSSSSSSSSTPTLLRHVTDTRFDDDKSDGNEDTLVSSASAVAAVIRKASSTSPVEFKQRIEKDAKSQGLVLPSPDFRRLCLEQLDIFSRIVHPSALLSVYVRPAGGYVMEQLELRRVIFYPGMNAAEIVVLIGNFSVPAGLRAAEAALSDHQAEFIPESAAVVFPMVKHPFVVGFLVAELPHVELQKENDSKQCMFSENFNTLPADAGSDFWNIEASMDSMLGGYKFTTEQRLNAINISCSIAMAYVMDQKAMLLQQSSWQNNVRMSNLVEQIRGPLSSIRTLSKMLSVHVKKSEISHDIVEDILVQGDQMRDTLQQLQDAVYLTKVNIVRYNEETMKMMHHSTNGHSESANSELSYNLPLETSTNKMQESGGRLSLASPSKDLELPMPPLALAPLQQKGIRRPCNVSDVLADLVGAAEPLARKQHRIVELCERSRGLQVAVEEPALRQALSNLIEGALLRTHVGGKVGILSIAAPAGGSLVIIDDDGPDMHYMTQMHSLMPFGTELLSEGMAEDNMTWNFVAGLTVAREILESYGCVIRVISPRSMDAALGAGGTRVELWLPSSSGSPKDGPAPDG